MRAACCATDFSTRPIPVQPCGPTPPTARARTRHSWRGNGFTSRVHRKKPVGRPMPMPIRRANGRKSIVRARIEHVFAEQKDRMGLFIRTIGLARARTQDRARQPRLQHQTLHLVGENRGGNIDAPQGPASARLPTNVPRELQHPLTHTPDASEKVNRGAHFYLLLKWLELLLLTIPGAPKAPVSPQRA